MDNVSLFHSFSKVAAADNTALSAAVNKAGHVVTASDVWANEVPFCGSADSLADIKTKFVDNTAFPVGTLGYDLSTSKLYQKGEADWTEITPAATGSYVTISYKNKPVLRWYNKAPLTLLTPENNGAPSNGFSAKYLGPAGDGVGAISQFVSSTDKIVNGIVSDGYDIAVYNGSTKLTKGTSTAAADNQWMDSAYAGMILFMCAQTSKNLSMTCFEYVGEKVSNVIDTIAAQGSTIDTHTSEISEIKEKLGLEDTTPDGTPSLGGRVTDNEAALRTLLGLESTAKVVATESIATTAAAAATNAINAIEVASTGDHGITASQTKGEIALSVVVATVGEDGAIAEASADNVVTATGAQNIAKAAATAAITDAIGEGSAITEEVQSQITAATLEGKISDDTDSTQLVTAEQVVTYVSENAKVTLSADTADGKTGIVIDNDGQEATSFTIGIDHSVIATKASVDAINTRLTTGDVATAISNAQSAAEAAQSTANTAVTNAATAQAAAEAAQGTANTAVTNAANAQSAAEAAQGDATQALADAAAAQTTANQGVADAATAQATAEAAQSAAEAAQGTADTAVTNAATAQSAAEAAQTTANKAVEDAAAAKKAGEDAAAGALSAAQTAQAAAEAAQGTADTAVTNAATAQAAAEAADAKAAKAATDAAAALATAKSELEGKITAAQTAAEKTASDALATAKSELEGKITAAEAAATTAGQNAANAAQTAAEATAKAYTDTEVKKVSDSLATAIADHSADIAKVEAAIEGITTSGFSRVIVETLPTEDIKLNAIYLVKNTESEAGEYIEYIYVQTLGKFEQIGSTKTDLSEYAKTADVTSAIATAKSEAIADAEGKVNALAATHATDKAALETSITTLTTIVTSNKEAADEAIAALAAADTGRVSVLEAQVAALTTGDTSVAKQIEAAVSAAQTTLQGNIDGVATRVTTLEDVTVPAVQAAAKAAQDTADAAQGAADKAQGDATQALADAATAQSAADAAQGDATQALTDAATAQSAADAAQDAADAAQGDATQALADAAAAQTTADSKIATVEVTTDAASHFGAHHISAVTDTDKNVTISVYRSDEWSVGETKPATTITSVINGKMSDGKTIDDANLVDGTSMFASNTSLTTYVGDLGKLTDGINMFFGCTSLTTFVADLGSLEYGNNMFSGCALDEESLIYIVDSLPDVSVAGRAAVEPPTPETNPGDGFTKYTIKVGVAAGVDKAPYVTEAAAKGWTLV